MKKAIMFILIAICLTGCSFNVDNIDNTPTKKVEAYFNNYQTLNKSVLDDLELVVQKEEKFSSDQKDKYRKIMKKNFSDLTYMIKEETVNGDTALVEVEINVNDYYKIHKATDSYLSENKQEFTVNGIFDESKFIDYKLEEMTKSNDKVKYTLYLNLSKNKDGKWELDDVSETDEDKILGLYAY